MVLEEHHYLFQNFQATENKDIQNGILDVYLKVESERENQESGKKSRDKESEKCEENDGDKDKEYKGGQCTSD